MDFTDESLQILARQMGEERVSSRAELEAKMTPMLRLVVRTGVGRPSLVQWVKRTLPLVMEAAQPGCPLDADWAASRLATLLCSQLLQRIRNQCHTIARTETTLAR